MADSGAPDDRYFDANLADPKSLAMARLAISRWEEIAPILTPMLGQREVARLFERSILLCNKTYPWLGGASEAFDASLDLNALERSIAQQPFEAAAAGAGMLLNTFYDLLGGLVGHEMAEQMLPCSLFRLGEQNAARLDDGCTGSSE